MDRNEVRRAWDSVSETYAEKRDPTGSDADLLADLRERLPGTPTVLDVGCGDGARTLANLPPDSIGLDFSRAGLNLATETAPNSRLVQGDMTTLPVAADSVDAVTAYHAVFRVPRDQHATVYQEFARVLRPDGMVLMTLPSGQFETVRRDWMGGSMFFSAPGRRATLDQLDAAGFTETDTVGCNYVKRFATPGWQNASMAYSRQYETVTATDPLGSDSEFVFATLGDD